MTLKQRENVWSLLLSLIGFLILATGKYTTEANHYVAAFMIMTCAVVFYVLFVVFVAQMNWLDIRAVFHGVWLGTIGMATLRLAQYQEPWQGKTWLLLAFAYEMFQIGANIGIVYGERLYAVLRSKVRKFKIGRIRFVMQPNRLFAVCVVTTLIGVICFGINIAIRGYIPAFSDNVNAYKDFYTKFHVFSVAATGASGLCYYCMRTQPISLPKKGILLLCIFYLVFLFPILVVSRGVFITAALSLATAVFYLHKKKLLALVLCICVMGGVYLGVSNLRKYTNEQLNEFFQPAEVELPELGPTDTNTVTGDDSSGEEKNKFVLSPKMAFLYGYLTVSHDNFNEAVKYTRGYTWGARQFKPFNVVLRNQYITNINNSGEYYQVNPYLNTTNLIGDFYYDFHEWGVVVLTLLWSIIFGFMQVCYTSGQGPFALLILGNTMSAVALCFFSTWLSVFEFWMMWGVALIFALVCCVTLEKKPADANK